MNALPTAGALALALCVLSTNSQAQEFCAPRENVVKNLTERYGESLVGTGIINPTTLLEMYSNEETGSFTVVISSYDEQLNQIISCMKVGGKDWIAYAPKPKGDPA